MDAWSGLQNRNYQLIEKLTAALDHVEMAVGDGVERSRINGHNRAAMRHFYAEPGH